MKVSDVLNRDNWIKGAMNDEGNHCLLGALEKIGDFHLSVPKGIAGPITKKFAEAVNILFPRPLLVDIPHNSYKYIYWFNDRPETSFDDIQRIVEYVEHPERLISGCVIIDEDFTQIEIPVELYEVRKDSPCGV